jgi:hypothetical protein
LDWFAQSFLLIYEVLFSPLVLVKNVVRGSIAESITFPSMFLEYQQLK